MYSFLFINLFIYLFIYYYFFNIFVGGGIGQGMYPYYPPPPPLFPSPQSSTMLIANLLECLTDKGLKPSFVTSSERLMRGFDVVDGG